MFVSNTLLSISWYSIEFLVNFLVQEHQSVINKTIDGISLNFWLIFWLKNTDVIRQLVVDFGSRRLGLLWSLLDIDARVWRLMLVWGEVVSVWLVFTFVAVWWFQLGKTRLGLCTQSLAIILSYEKILQSIRWSTYNYNLYFSEYMPEYFTAGATLSLINIFKRFQWVF